MASWLRLWHDMPTDPKWRVIAKRSGQSIGNVIAVYSLMLVSASVADERGTITNWSDEDAAAALDLEPENVTAIREAMQGKVLDGETLSGWNKRQPEREDYSTPRVKRYREKQAGNETQCNADETHRNNTDTEQNRTDTEQIPQVAPTSDIPPTIIHPKQAIPLNRVHDCWLKGIQATGESLTIQDLTPEFERTLKGVLYDKTGGVVKWLAATRALARAPASVKYEKSVTWLLQDQFKALNRVVTWAAQDRGTSGNGNTNYVEAPEEWKKRYADSAPR